MMPLKDVEQAAAALSSQITAGITLDRAVRRLKQIQRPYADFWESVALGIEAGNPISQYLDGHWPEAIVNSVRAGELSGKYQEVFSQIESTIAIQREIQGQVWQLAYPFTFALVGIAIFVYFMISVLPSLSKSLGNGEKGFVFRMSSWMSNFVEQNWIVTLVSIAIVAMLVITWLKDPENRAKVVEVMLGMPILGEALNYLYFGIWSYYMALINSSGSITTPDGLKLSSKVLPVPMREGIILLADESTVKGLGPAADPEKLSSSDPRQKWPFYVHNAMMLANDSQMIDRELLRIAPVLVKTGKTMMKRVIFIANIIALIFAAIFIVGPLVAYYVQLGVVLQAAMRG